MQPHTVALINVAAFSLHHPDQSSFNFRVRVASDKYQHYGISINKSGDRFSGTVTPEGGPSWSCYIDMEIKDGYKLNITRHQHPWLPTGIQETCSLDIGKNQIGSGYVSNSIFGKNGSFSGRIGDSGREIEIRSNTNGKTYRSRLS